MKISIVTLLFFLISIVFVAGQATTYYKDSQLDEETIESKAKFSKTITSLPDGREMTKIVDIKNNRTIMEEDNHGEPFGVWSNKTGSGFVQLNYDFQLVYNKGGCPSSLMIQGISGPFMNNDSIGYEAPKLKNGDGFIKYVVSNLRYPAFARRRGVEGKVIVTFTITEAGLIENVEVLKGVHVSLDKEAVRIIRELELGSPPKVNGEVKNVCVSLPITFKLT